MTTPVSADVALPSMSKDLALLFAEHEAPKFCSLQQAKDMLLPIEDVLCAERSQMAEYRRLLRVAELSAEINPQVLGKVRLLRTLLKNMGAALEAAADPLQRYTDERHKFENAMLEARTALETRDAIAETPVGA